MTPPFFSFMCLSPIIDKNGYVLACGKCMECRLTRSNEWSYRLMDESSLYVDKFFLTLTYNEAHLPKNGDLCRRDLQLFIKRLRKRISPVKIRYFYCGEYGSEKGRCHYHLIVFGWLPNDLYFFKKSKKGEPMFRSPFLEDLWSVSVKDEFGNILYSKSGKPLTEPIGFVSIEFLENISQARYISLYMQKPPKDGRSKPFVGMSQGIGKGSIDFDKLKIDGNIWHNGKYIRAPRYYRKLAKDNGIDLSRPLLCLNTEKQIVLYLKNCYYRNKNFYTKFKSLGKMPKDFATFVGLNPYFIDFIRKKKVFPKNFLSKY